MCVCVCVFVFKIYPLLDLGKGELSIIRQVLIFLYQDEPIKMN